MSPRSAECAAFIARCGWADARVAPLAGDASNRRYLRLRRRDGTPAVLMDAPPERGEDVRPFLSIARHLTRHGLRAPAILAADEYQGLLLLEDLGDTLFARVLEADPAQEHMLYTAATDVLIHLHRAPLPNPVEVYGAHAMADKAALAVDWYAPEHGLRSAVQTAMEDAIDTHAPGTDALALRDYHAENLLWLPGDGTDRVGLLDFQDAMAAHPAYDLVSLLTDARRDVRPETVAAMTAHYISKQGLAAAPFHTAFAVLSAQRNLRILGVFARLCLRDGKPGYLRFMPRVWAQLQRALEHPTLTGLRQATANFPEPSAKRLAELEDACGTQPDR